MQLISIQYLRAIAAIMVLLSHVEFKIRRTTNYDLSLFQIGGYGVDLFFIISGFIICFSLNNKKRNIINFLKSRIKRVIPLYWFLTSAALVVYLIRPSLINSSGGETNILSSYFLLPSGHKFLIQNGWTLSFEFLFYFIAGLSLFFKKNKMFIQLAFMTALVLLGRVLKYDNSYFNFVTSPYLIEFQLGILAYILHRKYKFSLTIILTVFIISLASIIYLNFSPNSFTGYYKVWTRGFSMLGLFISILYMEPFFKPHKLLIEIGNSSYSLYLIHPFILVLCTLLFKKINFINGNGITQGLIMIILSIISGLVCYYKIEKKLVFS